MRRALRRLSIVNNRLYGTAKSAPAVARSDRSGFWNGGNFARPFLQNLSLGSMLSTSGGPEKRKAAMMPLTARPVSTRPRSFSEPYIGTGISSKLSLSRPPPPTSEDSVKILEPDEEDIFKIVLTGGPCAGKTTVMARLKIFLLSRGFRVFVAPEAATMLFLAGVSFGDIADDKGKLAFQKNLLKTQLHLEDSLTQLAHSVGKPAVVLCDRGTMDGRAYVSKEVWNNVLSEINTDNVTLRDARYNAVLHMVTAAIGAEEFYDLKSNATRSESVEEAAKLDRKTQQCWVGHPRVMTFDNSTPFEGKIQRVIRAVSRIIGFPLTTKKFKKFKLKENFILPDTILKSAEVFDIEKVYLLPGPRARKEQTKYICIRRRKAVKSVGLNVAFGMTRLKRGPDGQYIELKRIITEREYTSLRESVPDPTRHVVRQRRTSFLHDGTYFQLDQYRAPVKVLGTAILSFQLAEGEAGQGEKMNLNFVPIERDVTGIAEFSAFQISLKESSAKSSDNAAPNREVF